MELFKYKKSSLNTLLSRYFGQAHILFDIFSIRVFVTCCITYSYVHVYLPLNTIDAVRCDYSLRKKYEAKWKKRHAIEGLLWNERRKGGSKKVEKRTRRNLRESLLSRQEVQTERLTFSIAQPGESLPFQMRKAFGMIHARPLRGGAVLVKVKAESGRMYAVPQKKSLASG